MEQCLYYKEIGLVQLSNLQTQLELRFKYGVWIKQEIKGGFH